LDRPHDAQLRPDDRSRAADSDDRFAPAKLATAVALANGLRVPDLSIAGSIAALGISAFYVVRLLQPARRDAAGLLGFVVFGLLAAGVLAARLLA
jgi:hypothetical protein